MSGLPDGMANGTSQSNLDGKDAQIWEKPWTLDEMRQTSANWSLAADSGLFLFLQDFSQRMLSRTHEIEKQLDGLIRDTKATDSCLHTVFNDFLMLSNTQFIENRVYDEEVEDPVPKVEAMEKQPELEKTREQKEAELIPKMQEAVNFGLKVLDSAFEQLDIKAGNSDSEDEEATDRVEPILEPKDLYVDRPLPYLIGSQLFMEQEDVGLGDLSSEEMSIDSDRDSVIESDDGKEADQSDEDFEQEGDGQGSIKKKSSMLSYEDEDEEDEDGDSDIFGDSDKDDDGDQRESTGPPSFADQLAARIKGEPVGKPEGDRTSLSSASKKKSKPKKEVKPSRAPVDGDSDELFKPPKMEDEDFSPFGGKGGLFSGGRGLFDDDDEGNLFSDAPKHPVAEEPTRTRAQSSELAKSAKKIPSDAVPDSGLFGSGNDSDSTESRENGSQAKPRTQTAPKQAPAGGVGGLFDDEEDDDFFSGQSLRKSISAGQDKAKPKKAVDLFGGDDEDEDEEGDIFSERSNAPPPLQSKKDVVEERVKQTVPEKKIPVGGVSMFGPGTKGLLTASATADTSGEVFPSIPKPETTSRTEGRKSTLSIFDDEEEEDLFASAAKSKPKQSDVPKGAATGVKKPVATSSLFSDDEDQWLSSKPSALEAKPGGMTSSISAPSSLGTKAAQKGSLFDEDDDLFAAAKSSSQKKPQRVSLLFEDEDEDKGFLFDFKPLVNDGTPAPAAKASVVTSTPPSLFDSEKMAVTSTPPSLFDSEKMAVTSTPPSLFDSEKMAVTSTPPSLFDSEKMAVTSSPPSLFDSEKMAGSPATDRTSPGEERAAEERSPGAQPPSPPPEGSAARKKPAGAVSLFGGIDVLASKLSKSPLDEPDGDDDFLSKDSPPPPVEKERKGDEKDVKTKNTTLSLFDGDEEGDDEAADWTAPISISSKPASKNTLQTPVERPRTKSTRVFQDEELLFSQTQQKDNDPDVDLFSTSAKAVSTKPSSAQAAAAPTLFADEDEDDLFSSVKPKAPPTAPKEKPSKESAAAVSETEANLQINPAALLPGAMSRVPGGVAVLPALSPSSSSEGPSPSPSPVTSPAGPHDASDGGVSFDGPAQVTTLRSTNKDRPRGSVRRRPQTRAARQLAAQLSEEQSEENQGEISGPNPALPSLALPNPARTASDLPGPTLPSPALPDPRPNTALLAKPPLTDGSSRPSVLALPVSTHPKKTDSAKGHSKPKEHSRPKVLPSPGVDDLFGSDSLFATAPAPKQTTPSPKLKTKKVEDGAGSNAALDKEKRGDTAPSIFDSHGDDLFQKVKPRSTQKPKASAFLEDEDEDIFGIGRSSTLTPTPKTSSNFAKRDIFQDPVEPTSKANKKHKDKSLDASLFDDNVDIFADLTVASKPKEKSKKVETKSIFDDDMDDIFSSNAGKAVARPSVTSQKTPPSQNSSTPDDSSSNIFDDPLNALGGN